jgi:UDP-N-acetylmuramate dehydrogenase
VQIEQVAVLIQTAHREGLPWIVIGKGSNLLFDDRGLRGLVIKLDRRLGAVDIQGDRVRAQAGTSMPRLALHVARRGLSGLEHTVGIPGSLGGLVVMNGGSLRQSIGEVITSVSYVDDRGTLQTRLPQDCAFAYRRSWFQNHTAVVVQVGLHLRPCPAHTLLPALRDILRERRHKFPLTHPNCGSVFKNSEHLYATAGPPGRAIEAMGLKGYRMGDAEISSRHANFIINRGHASSHDILRLIQYIRTRAQATWNCSLETEVRYVDEQGGIRPAHEQSRKVPIGYRDSLSSRKGIAHTAQA